MKAMMLEQRNAFLAVAAEREPECFPAFMLMGLAGLRMGECLGAKWPSVDLETKKLRVHEQLLSESTKTGVGRTVDLAAAVVEMLRGVLARRREASMAAGRGGDVSP